MKALGYTVVKNALANVIRGGSSAIAALALPHFLTRLLNHDQFASWSLMLQIAAYANYFDFGLQTAIARYLAQAMESGEEKRRDRLVSTAFSLLAGIGLLAFGLLGAIIWKLPSIFRTMPMHSVTDLRMGLLVMTVFITVALPMSTFTAVLIGLHRNEYPALAIGGSRILGTLAVLASVHYTHSLASLAFCLGTFNLLGYVAQYFIASHLIPGMRVHRLFIDREMARELLVYCSTLSIWTFGMLLVSGLDVTIVGYFDFSAVGYYSIAATLISFFTGFNNSIFSAMLTPVAVLQSRKEYGRIRNLIIRSTRLNTYANIALTMSVILWGATLLRVWVGPAYGAKALPILEILLVAQTIRLMGSAYATVLMAMGMQRYGLYAAITEGVSNLLLSVAGMIFFGAPGVAWGTFVAAVIGLAMQVLQVMRWAVEIPINRRAFLRAGIFQPLLAFLPLVFWATFHSWYVSRFQPSWLETEVPLLACILFTGWLIFAGIRHRDREILEPAG